MDGCCRLGCARKGLGGADGWGGGRTLEEVL